MLKLKKSHNISFTSIPSLVALFAVLCSLSGLFLPFLFSATQSVGWSLIHIFKYSYTSINISIIVIVFIAILLYLMNIFIEPSWSSYFICATLSVALCVAPTIIYYTLANKLGLIHANLSLHAGAVLMIISALAFAGLEIYRLGTIDKQMSQRLMLKSEGRLKKFYYTKKSKYKADEILNKVAENMAKEKGLEEKSLQTLEKKPRKKTTDNKPQKKKPTKENKSKKTTIVIK